MKLKEIKKLREHAKVLRKKKYTKNGMKKCKKISADKSDCIVWKKLIKREQKKRNSMKLFKENKTF